MKRWKSQKSQNGWKARIQYSHIQFTGRSRVPTAAGAVAYANTPRYADVSERDHT